jgi:pimeloyl-ACP methyl ester carboxylesterase
VVCADLPGQPGLSAATRPRDEVEGYGRWVGEVLSQVRETAGASPVALVGHSRGAAVALLAEPAHVDGLLLLCPAGLVGVRLTPAVMIRSVAWLLRPDRRRTRRLVDLMAGGPGAAAVPDEVVEWLALTARDTRTTGAPGPLPAGVVERWRGRRVAVLAGAHDAFFPPQRLAAPARDRLGVPVDTVPGAGHLLTDQHPDVVADRTRALLER